MKTLRAHPGGFKRRPTGWTMTAGWREGGSGITAWGGDGGGVTRVFALGPSLHGTWVPGPPAPPSPRGQKKARDASLDAPAPPGTMSPKEMTSSPVQPSLLGPAMPRTGRGHVGALACPLGPRDRLRWSVKNVLTPGKRRKSKWDVKRSFP